MPRLVTVAAVLTITVGCFDADAVRDSKPAAARPDNNNEATKMKTERAMDWDDPLDPIAITTDEIISGELAIVLVTHDAGHGGWQFMDGQDVSGRKPVVIPKSELLQIDPTIKEITDLPVGWRAVRDSKDEPWRREVNPNARQ